MSILSNVKEHRVSTQVMLDYAMHDEVLKEELDWTIEQLKGFENSPYYSLGEKVTREILTASYLLEEYKSATRELAGKSVHWLKEMDVLAKAVMRYKWVFKEFTNYRQVKYKFLPIVANVLKFTPQHLGSLFKSNIFSGSRTANMRYAFSYQYTLDVLQSAQDGSFTLRNELVKSYSWFGKFITTNLDQILKESNRIAVEFDRTTLAIYRELEKEGASKELTEAFGNSTDYISKLPQLRYLLRTVDSVKDFFKVEFGEKLRQIMGSKFIYKMDEQTKELFIGKLEKYGIDLSFISNSWKEVFGLT